MGGRVEELELEWWEGLGTVKNIDTDIEESMSQGDACQGASRNTPETELKGIHGRESVAANSNDWRVGQEYAKLSGKNSREVHWSPILRVLPSVRVGSHFAGNSLSHV